MVPTFRLHRPTTLDDALDLLASLGDGARPYAGGSELLLVLREGLLDADDLVDLKRVAGLADIRMLADEHELEIGALTTHTQVAESPLVRARLPALAATEAVLANRRVRNTGTVGGSLCFAEPHGDTAALLLAVDARVVLRGTDGIRHVPLDAWLQGPFDVDLKTGEILLAVRIPTTLGRRALTYHRARVLERPTASAAVAMHVSPDDDLARDVRVVVGCVGPRPTRVPEAEALLAEHPARPSAERVATVAAECGTIAGRRADVVADIYGPEAYKRRLVSVLVRRAVVDAFAMLSGPGTEDGPAAP